METKRELSEEIVIVGSRYGDLADVVKPLFEQAEPIEGENIVEVLGGVEVYCLFKTLPATGILQM